MEQLPRPAEEKRVKLMKDEYDPRDLKFTELKHMYLKELSGPSLVRMEANKRVAMAQQIWKKPQEYKAKSKVDKLLDSIEKKEREQQNGGGGRNDEREIYVQVLDLNYRNKMIKQRDVDELHQKTANMNKIFEQIDEYGYQRRQQLHNSQKNQNKAPKKNKTLIQQLQQKLFSDPNASQMDPHSQDSRKEEQPEPHEEDGQSSRRIKNLTTTNIQNNFSTRGDEIDTSAPAKSTKRKQNHPDFYQLITSIDPFQRSANQSYGLAPNQSHSLAPNQSYGLPPNQSYSLAASDYQLDTDHPTNQSASHSKLVNALKVLDLKKNRSQKLFSSPEQFKDFMMHRKNSQQRNVYSLNTHFPPNDSTIQMAQRQTDQSYITSLLNNKTRILDTENSVHNHSSFLNQSASVPRLPQIKLGSTPQHSSQIKLLPASSVE